MTSPVTDADVLRIIQQPRSDFFPVPMRGPTEPEDAAADAVRDTGTQGQIEGYETWVRSQQGRYA